MRLGDGSPEAAGGGGHVLAGAHTCVRGDGSLPLPPGEDSSLAPGPASAWREW